MRKIIFSLLILVACTSLKAQLANKKWTGTLQLDQPLDIVLDFKKDTLHAVRTGDGQVIESMVFTVKKDILTLKKTYGQSDCSGEIIGKYKFAVIKDSLLLTLIDDQCTDRSGVLDKTKWSRKK